LLAILFNEGEGWDEDGIVNSNQGFSVEALEQEVGCFAFVVGEESLVETGVHRHRRLIAEEDREEFERGDVAAHDNETDGKGYGQDESDGSPDECPERGSDEDGERGKSSVAPIDVWFEVVAGDEFEESEDGRDEDGVFPAMENGDGEEERRGSCGRDSDIGNKPAECGESSEENRMRKSNEVERGGNDGAESEIDGELE
jgi:hypothetical protein